MKIAVFDIGGTAVKYGVYDSAIEDDASPAGVLTSIGSFPTKGEEGPESLFRRIKDTYKELCRCEGAKSIYGDIQTPPLPIGICTRGQVNPGTGTIIHDLPDIMPGYAGFNIINALADINVPVTVENDANCAAYAEHTIIARLTGRTPASLACLTFGTCIGGALILDGSIYHGAHFSAGEAGMIYDGGVYCETIASAKALESSSDFSDWVMKAASCGASVIHLLDPEYLILGGAIMEDSTIYDALIKKIRELLAPGFDVSILPASAGNSAGLLGIGLLASK